MQNTPKICVPIKLSTNQAVVDFMQKNQDKADIFEIWLDQINDLNFPEIFNNKTKPILCVCKGSKEKGNFKGSEYEKTELLKVAILQGADYIDLDYQTEDVLIKDLINNKGDAKISLSYHNFELTPDLKTLLDVIQKTLKFKPDIVKIATMANSYKDALIILNLAQALTTAKIPFIAIAMSNYGKLTRVITPLLGGEMMFAPLEASENTANGQIEAKRLQELWEEFS